MSDNRLSFWFDFASPYAYFASLQVDAMDERLALVTEWRPFLLGAVFPVTSMRPLSETPLRGEYARHDWLRLARRLSASFVPPKGPVANTAYAARAFYWIADNQSVNAVPFARSLLASYFGTGNESAFEKTYLLNVAEELHVDVGQLEVALRSEKMKLKIRNVTAEAVAKGVFGSPFFFVGSEPFWGQDRLPEIERWLTSGGW